MQRTIKFRGKRLDNGQWAEGLLVYLNVIRVFTDHKFDNDGKVGVYQSTEDVQVDPATVGQFTGLHDKNGVEIYEGDYLRGIQRNQEDTEGKDAFPVNDVVKWGHGGFEVFSKSIQGGYFKEGFRLHRFMWVIQSHNSIPKQYYQIDDIEVIGNIHDNPDLLK